MWRKKVYMIAQCPQCGQAEIAGSARNAGSKTGILSTSTCSECHTIFHLLCCVGCGERVTTARTTTRCVTCRDAATHAV